MKGQVCLSTDYFERLAFWTCDIVVNEARFGSRQIDPREEQSMNLGFFTMPMHPLDKDCRLSLKEDREAFLLADDLSFTEPYLVHPATSPPHTLTPSTPLP